MTKELEALLPVPETPVELPGEGDWGRIEAQFTRLPDDFKHFIDHYGTGVIGSGYITIFNPFAQDPYLNLVHQAGIVAAAFRQLNERYPDQYKMSFFPTEGGFLPFGVNVDGAYLVWSTEGDPNDWPVVVIGPRSPRTQEFHMGFVPWFVNLLARRVRCIFFDRSFPTIVDFINT
jgi:hypothetical protein